MELRYGIRTEGDVDLEELGVAAEHRLGYEGSHWVGVRRALQRLAVTQHDVFADFGSGKGPAVLVAATFLSGASSGRGLRTTSPARPRPTSSVRACARGRGRSSSSRRTCSSSRFRRPERRLSLQPVHRAAVRAIRGAPAALARAPPAAPAGRLQLPVRARLRDRHRPVPPDRPHPQLLAGVVPAARLRDPHLRGAHRGRPRVRLAAGKRSSPAPLGPWAARTTPAGSSWAAARHTRGRGPGASSSAPRWNQSSTPRSRAAGRRSTGTSAGGGP